MGQISISGYEDELTVTGGRRRPPGAQAARGGPADQPARLSADEDGRWLRSLRAGRPPGDVRFRTDAEMVTGGIYEWTAHDAGTREWRSGWCRDIHWGFSTVDKVVKGWLARPGAF
jgi:hypothetical protein